MNTPVSFEIAKLLKEIGFTTPCFYFYENEKLIEPYLENGSSTDTEFRVDLSDLKEHFNKWSKRISAPTIAEVVMWLYKNYKIWISVGGDCDYKFRFEIHKWNWYELEKTYRLGHVVLGESLWDTASSHFNSPTEAYEAGIKYVLENLIK